MELVESDCLRGSVLRVVGLFHPLRLNPASAPPMPVPHPDPDPAPA